jgi:aryl carrier-like protein
MLLQLLEEDGMSAVELTPDTVLLDTGLDSLGLAVLVTRLETELGYDPFSLMTEAVYPRTLNDFVVIYDKYAPGS